MSLNYPLLSGLFLGTLVSFLVTSLVMRWRVLDHPNDRSAHDQSIPKAGGLGIMSGVVVALATLASNGGFAADGKAVIALIVLALLTGGLGLYDDLRDLSAKLKFVILAGLALLAAGLIYPVNGFALDQAQVSLPYIMAILGTALWVFVLGNGANFMDGADGLIAGSSVVAALFLAILSAAAGQGIALQLSLALLAAILGFLPLNLPPARIFLGDTGALFIGFWLAGTALFYIHEGPPGAVYAVVLLFMPWLSDVLLTMAWRAMRRENLLQAHNDHIFQLALRAGFSHGQIALFMALQMLICGGLAWVFRTSATSELLAFAGMAVLAIIGHWWARVAFASNPESAGNAQAPER